MDACCTAIRKITDCIANGLEITANTGPNGRLALHPAGAVTKPSGPEGTRLGDPGAGQRGHSQSRVFSSGLTLTDATVFLPEAHKQATALHTPLRRNGLPEDVAGAVVGILRSGFVPGVTLPANGGLQVN